MGFSLQIDNLGEAGTFVASPFIVSSGPVPPRPHTHTHTMLSWDFPGGPVVKALRFHCSGRGAIPGRGTKIPHDECGQKMEKTETKKKKIIKKKKKAWLLSIWKNTLHQFPCVYWLSLQFVSGREQCSWGNKHNISSSKKRQRRKPTSIVLVWKRLSNVKWLIPLMI